MAAHSAQEMLRQMTFPQEEELAGTSRTTVLSGPMTGHREFHFNANETPSVGVRRFYVDRSALGGVGLFASRDLKAGEMVYREPADIAVLDTHMLGEACSSCFVWVPETPVVTRGDTRAVVEGEQIQQIKLKTCGGCKVEKYCSKTCQAHSWKTYHKHECKIYAKLHPQLLPNAVRIALRLLVGEKINTSGRKILELIGQCESHMTKIREKGGDMWENIRLMATAAKNYSGTSRTQNFVTELMCRIGINCHTLVTPTYDPIGVSIDMTTASFNHDCDPNTVISLDGAMISAIALKPIQKNLELTISYIDNTNPYHMRLVQLHNRWFFICRCSVCEKKESGKQNMFLPGFKTDDKRLKDIEDESFKALDKVNFLRDDPFKVQGHLMEAMAVLRKTKAWPPERQPYPALRQELIVALLSSLMWADALAHALNSWFWIDPLLYPQRAHPLRVVHSWVLARLIGYIRHDQDAMEQLAKYRVRWGMVEWIFLAEVSSHMGQSHGDGTQFEGMVEKTRFEVQQELVRSGKEFQASSTQFEEEMGKLMKIARDYVSY